MDLRGTVRIDLRGLNELRGKFSGAAAAVRTERAQAIDEVEDLALRFLRRYPPPRPNATYRRTYRLREGWQAGVRVFTHTAHLTVKNPVAYAPFVQDADRQAWMHRGRWQTVQDFISQKAAAVQGAFDRAAKRVARRLND